MNECQEACRIFGSSCEYLRYNKLDKECELLDSTSRTCSVFVGPPNPVYEECYEKTTPSISTPEIITIQKPSSATTSISTSTPISTSITSTAPRKLSSKIFLVGGLNHTNTVEKLDPFVSYSNCVPPNEYPVMIKQPTVDVIDRGLIVSCGGQAFVDGGFKYWNKCYSYNTKTVEWNEFAEMIEGRSEAASILLNDNKIWITGGWIRNPNGGGESTATTEILDIESATFSKGPDLPTWMYTHCLVRYNETHVFLGAIGSFEDDQTQFWTPYLVDIEQEPFVFHALPDMSNGRDGGGCAVIDVDFIGAKNPPNNYSTSFESRRAIIVAGGYGYNNMGVLTGKNDSEMLILEDGVWKDGPQLTRGFAYGGYTTVNGNEMLLVGGHDDDGYPSDTVMKLDPVSGRFETLPGRLQSSNSYFGMTTIFDNDDC